MRKVCGVIWCYVGNEADAAEAMAPLLEALPEPLLHGPGEVPLPALQSTFDPSIRRDQWYWRADFVKEIPDEAIEIHAKFGAEMPTWKSTMHLYPTDGAAHDVGPTDTPWAYRDALWGSVFCGVGPRPCQRGDDPEVVRRLLEALHPYSAGGAYVNMMMDEGQDRVRASYGKNYERLAEVKAKYDPENLFRVEPNIRRVPERDHDVVIVGGSLARCAAARLLALRGARVAVVEKQPELDAYE